MTRDEYRAKQPKPKKKFRVVLWSFVCLLLVALGLLLIFNQSVTNQIVANTGRTYARQVTPSKNTDEQKGLIETVKANEEKPGDFNFVNVKALTTLDLVGQNYTNLPVIGGIAIPDLGVNLGVFKGLSNANLAVGAGTMKEDQQMGVGNYSLASHSVFEGWSYANLLFTPLHNARVGQNIYLHDGEYVYTYRTSKIFEVTPDAVWVTDDGKEPMVTLITCTDAYATKRLIVQGTLVSKTPMNEAPQDILDYFASDWTRLWWN